MKQGNPSQGDPVEERAARIKLELSEGKMTSALELGSMSTRRRRIAEISRRHKDEGLRTLAHFIDIHWLYAAWKKTRKDGALGVDDMTWGEYDRQWHGNLDFLLERFKSGEYYAPPAKRSYIPKDDGKQRPIGIMTMEDKVLQRGVSMVLEDIYEQEFYDFSFGYRKGRSQHQALEVIWETLMNFNGGYVLSLDVQGYFDTVRHSDLRMFLDRRVRDGVIRKTIDKWLKAGVMEGGQVHVSEEGTPQGGVISPMLSNIYLHNVLDEWMVKTVIPRLKGRAEMIRYADDVLIVFSCEEDAKRVKRVLTKRFAKYGLKAHPEKTKLINFKKPGRNGRRRDGGKPGSIDFLGFTLHWGLSRKGNPVVKRKTMKSRLKRSLGRSKEWLRANRNMKIRKQWKAINSKLKGHYQYFGVTGNIASLQLYYQEVRRLWCYWLRRRSQRSKMTWERFNRILGYLQLARPHIPKSVYRT